MKYKVGDEVVLKINTRPGERLPRWEARKIQIIGAGVNPDDDQYLCYIPCYITLPFMFTINTTHQRFFMLDSKFLGEQGTFITDTDEIYEHIPTPDGSICDKCRNFFRLAEINETTGTFRCRSCRDNPYR